MREPQHPAIDQFDLPTILYALGDPVRLKILQSLGHGGEMTCGCFNVNLQKSALSHHFKVLREAGLILVRRDGIQRHISIRTADLETRFPGLLDAVLRNARTAETPSAETAPDSPPAMVPNS